MNPGKRELKNHTWNPASSTRLLGEPSPPNQSESIANRQKVRIDFLFHQQDTFYYDIVLCSPGSEDCPNISVNRNTLHRHYLSMTWRHLYY